MQDAERMGDSPASPASNASHYSGDEANDQSSKNPSAKDKECPYCHQQFTSSSLGRHLDQFIHKKKPDGIHNVDEIRKLRGGITRRTARGNKKEQHDGSSARTTPAAQQQHFPYPAPIENAAPMVDLNAVPPGGIQGRLNSLNWQATGVINHPSDLPSTLPSIPSTAHLPSPATIGNLKKRSFTTYADDLSPANLSETARALELSLREVLDSLRAATKHASVPPSPFAFDIQSQTFPSLILHLLPTPPTLHQSSPFSTLATTPISAPGPDQLQPLRTSITSSIDTWKWQALRLAQRTTSNIADEADFLSRQADSYSHIALLHLSTAYENWMAHPPEIRDLLWHVELLRAFQTQKDRVSELEERMDELQQEANQLQQQIEYLSRCQWPREMALWPPDRHIFSRKMAEEVRLINLQKPIAGGNGSAISTTTTHGDGRNDEAGDGIDPNVKTENINTKGDEGKWDFEKLVGKWRAHVKEDRVRRTPYIQSTGGSSSSPYPYPHPSAAHVSAGNGSGSGSGSGSTGNNNNGAGIGNGSARVAPGPGAMHWVGEKGARTSTHTPMQWTTETPPITNSGGRGGGGGEVVVNGVYGNGSGNGNADGGPADGVGVGGGEDKRRTRSRANNWKNISIISDFGGD